MPRSEQIRAKILQLKSDLEYLRMQKCVLDFEIVSEPSFNNSKRIYQKNFRKLTIIDAKISKIESDFKFLRSKLAEFKERLKNI